MKNVQQLTEFREVEETYNDTLSIEQLRKMSYIERLKRSQKRIYKLLTRLGYASIMPVILLLIVSSVCYGKDVCQASYYTSDSCRREGTSGVYTANGERYNENGYTCAMRNRTYDSIYKVTNVANGKSVIVRHNDYGPNKSLYDNGRRIDLSRAAFEQIADLKQGVITVEVTRMR